MSQDFQWLYILALKHRVGLKTCIVDGSISIVADGTVNGMEFYDIFRLN